MPVNQPTQLTNSATDQKTALITFRQHVTNSLGLIDIAQIVRTRFSVSVSGMSGEGGDQTQ